MRWVAGRRFSPKAEQQRFIDRVFGAEQIVMLQGPPGTGKTETLQLAVLAHVAAHRANSSMQGVDGCSNPQSHTRIRQQTRALLAGILPRRRQRPKRPKHLPCAKQFHLVSPSYRRSQIRQLQRRRRNRQRTHRLPDESSNTNTGYFGL